MISDTGILVVAVHIFHNCVIGHFTLVWYQTFFVGCYFVTLNLLLKEYTLK